LACAAGKLEHHDIEVDDFQLCKDYNGVEFVQFTEGQTKTRQGGLHTKHRDFQPRMFAVGGQRCPRALFKHFVSRPPQNLKTTGPLQRVTSPSKQTGGQMTTCGLKNNQ